MNQSIKENSQSGNSNLPEKKFRAGAICATVWKNEGTTKDGTDIEFRTVSFDRRYKDNKSGEWKSSSSLRITDIPKAALVLNKAFEYLVLTGQEHQIAV